MRDCLRNWLSQEDMKKPARARAAAIFVRWDCLLGPMTPRKSPCLSLRNCWRCGIVRPAEGITVLAKLGVILGGDGAGQAVLSPAWQWHLWTVFALVPEKPFHQGRA